MRYEGCFDVLAIKTNHKRNEIIIEGSLMKLITLEVTETYQHMEALSAITVSKAVF